MAKYGIPYQGSKSSIADDIISFLPAGKRFVDLFGGGFAMSECAVKSGKYENVYYNEINPLLPELLKNAMDGNYNYDKFKPDFISREKFFELKDKDGYIKYIWSFSNGGQTYLFGKNIEPIKKSLHNFVVFNVKDDWIKSNFNDIDKYIKGDDIYKRRVLLGRYMKMKGTKRPYKELQQLQRLQQLERLQRLEQLERLKITINCGSYLDYKYQEGDIVYCDPPYENTAQYEKCNSFDSKQFYEWVASRPYQVYFSSYQISDKRFNMIWAKGKVNLKARAKWRKKNYECLYTNT